jgi:hypothetical protein
VFLTVQTTAANNGNAGFLTVMKALCECRVTVRHVPTESSEDSGEMMRALLESTHPTNRGWEYDVSHGTQPVTHLNLPGRGFPQRHCAFAMKRYKPQQSGAYSHCEKLVGPQRVASQTLRKRSPYFCHLWLLRACDRLNLDARSFKVPTGAKKLECRSLAWILTSDNCARACKDKFILQGCELYLI